MKTTIYINQDAMQVVCDAGKGNVQYRNIELAAGTILNGVIVNEAEILAKLAEIEKKWRKGGVSLVIDSSNIMVKKLETPPLPTKNLPNVLKGEFEVMDESNYIYDFSLLDSTKEGHTLFAAAAQRDLLAKYVAMFKKAKIKLNSVDIAINSVIKYAHQNKALQEKSFVLNIVSRNMMLTLMFEHGMYKMSNRNRLINEVGTDAYVSELYEKLSSVLQFSYTQRSQYPVEESYYIGIDDASVAALAQYAEDQNIKVLSFEDGAMDTSCFYAACGLQTIKKDIDFIAAQKETDKKPIRIPAVVWQALFLAVLAGGVWYIYDGWNTKNIALEQEIATLQSYIDSQEVADAKAEIAVVNAAQSDLDDKIDEASYVVAEIDDSKIFSAEMLTTVHSSEIIGSLSYNLGSEKTIAISGTAADITGSANYAEMLRDSGYFTSLYYTGYSVSTTSEDDDTETSTYNFNVNASMQQLEEEATND